MSLNKQDLDNYITGHYGEDQFREDTCTSLCDPEMDFHCEECIKASVSGVSAEREQAAFDAAMPIESLERSKPE